MKYRRYWGGSGGVRLLGEGGEREGQGVIMTTNSGGVGEGGEGEMGVNQSAEVEKRVKEAQSTTRDSKWRPRNTMVTLTLLPHHYSCIQLKSKEK